MATFRDTEGREWIVRVNVTSLTEVKEAVKIDLLDIGSPESGTLAKLYADPILLGAVVYAFCEPQAKGRQISPEDFGRALAGDAIADAYKAITEELVNFSPSQRQRKRARARMDRIDKAEKKLDDLLDAAMDSPEMEVATEVEIKRVAAKIVQRLNHSGNSSIGAPESSDSTPDLTPSES